VKAELLDLSIVPGLEHADTRVPIDVQPGSQAFLAATAVVEAHQAGFMETCVAQPGAADCLTGGDLPSMTAAFPSPGSVGEGYTTIHGAGTPTTTGPMEIIYRIEGAAKANHLLGFYLVVGL
jgi:hypothetical protein